jgi:peptidoglycan/xylan/chitin deacetylase (PgdA/CDA1 family)
MIKRLINLAGSLVVRASDWIGDKVGRLFGRSPKHRCVVLAYHSVSAKQRLVFAEQMEIVARMGKGIHADVNTLPEQGGRYVAITFDDGLEDIIENALPELKRRGLPSTVFVISDMLGRQRTWEHLGGEDTSDVKVMSLEQLLALPSELVRIGSHSMTHAFLPKLEKEKVQQEVSESRAQLEKILKCEIKLFSLPYGAFNDSVIQDCRAAGYGRVFTGLPVLAFTQPNEFLTGRVVTMLTDWPIEFKLKVAGAYRWLPYAYGLKRRVLSVVRGSRRRPVHA